MNRTLARRVTIVGVVRLAAILGVVCGLSCSPQQREATSILLITLDTTRADRIGCYGDERALTPVLDSLATRGVRFTQCITPTPLTLPSHTSMFTGLNPSRHGVRDNGVFLLPEALAVVTDRFKSAGYQTGAFVSAFVLARQFGLDRGFDTYDDRFYTERVGTRTTAAATRWIKGLDPERPYFLWVHYFDPHLPWRAPEPYRSLDLPDGYAKEIAAMDGSIGELLGSLRRRGLLANTTVLVVGDHGEGLGDHGEDEHGIFLYDETLRVPLLLCVPDGPTARVVETRTSIIDVAPTLLEAARLPALDAIEGKSLFGLLAGEPAFRRAEYAETYFPQLNYEHAMLRALRTERWKYIRAPQPELYRLADDPGERRNVFAEFPDTVLLFEDRLDRYLASLPPLPSGASSLSDEDRERLQSLGYLAGDGAPAPSPASENLPDPKEMLPYLPTFAEAKHAFQEGRWEDAARGFRAVLDHNPGSRVAALDLGKTLFRLRRPGEAAEVLEQAWQLSPDNGSLAKNLGEALRRDQRPAEALEAYRSALRDPHQHWSAVVGVVGSLIDLGRLDEARSFMTAEAARTSGRVDSTSAYAMSQKLTRQITRYQTLRGRREASPTDPILRLDLAGAAFDLGLWNEARRVLDFRTNDAHLEGSRQRILGSVALADADEAAALANFESARRKLPDDAYVLGHLVSLYLGAGRTAEALATADRAVRLDPKNAVLHYNRGCAQALSGQTGAAVASLERAVQLGYANAAKLLEDPDLGALQGDARFLELAEKAAR